MLAANEAVATALREKKIGLLYRVHETPDSEKMEETMKVLGRFKLAVPDLEEITPQAIQNILKRVADRDEAPLVNMLMLRSMKLARYTSKNDIHFGLALENYCHFTSPIRRYPDLIVHRMLKKGLIEPDVPRVKNWESYLPTQGEHCSTMERKAEQCSRDCVKAKQIRYLQKHIGEEFEARIISTTKFGMFADIVDFPAEGLIGLGSMRDDFYNFEPESYQLVGERTGKRYQMGQIVKIRIVRADWESLQADFELIEN